MYATKVTDSDVRKVLEVFPHFMPITLRLVFEFTMKRVCGTLQFFNGLKFLKQIKVLCNNKIIPFLLSSPV